MSHVIKVIAIFPPIDSAIFLAISTKFSFDMSQENFHRDAQNRSSPALPELTYSVKIFAAISYC